MTEPKSGIMGYLIDERNRGKFLHTSGQVRNTQGGNIGSAGGKNDTFAMRQEIEKQRRFVKKYNNARVISDVRAFDRVRGTVLNGVKTESTRSRLASESNSAAASRGSIGSSARNSGFSGRSSANPTTRTQVAPPTYRNPGIHR